MKLMRRKGVGNGREVMKMLVAMRMNRTTHVITER